MLYYAAHSSHSDNFFGSIQMKLGNRQIAIAGLSFVIMVLAPQWGRSDELNACFTCEELSVILPDLLAAEHPEVTNLAVETKTTIENPIPGGDPIPVAAYCEVRGVRFYDPFILRLPASADWNGRYYQTGNGGAGGSIDVDGINSGLLAGFAAAGASGGHDGSLPFPLFLWAYPPSDPVAQQKVDDYCFGSVHETSVLAKEIIAAYYCSEGGPEYAYYNSCSTGGRQGLIEVQRYPDDFDGLLVGAPVNNLVRITHVGVWRGQALLGDANVPLENLPVLAEAVMKRCDSIDGLVDGLIDDPRNCYFNALTDLPACEEYPELPDTDCFTLAQREAVQKIYDDSPGYASLAGAPYGSEAMSPVPSYLGGGMFSGWEQWIIPTSPFGSLGLLLSAHLLQWMALPAIGSGGPVWDWATYDLLGPEPEAVVESFAPICDALDQDLTAFKDTGGKVIQWGGWADPATGAYQWADYYDGVLETMGNESTKDFYKLYMLPGTLHCGGGNGCFDSLGDKQALFWRLVNWVENENEPNAWEGSRIVDGEVVRTRPQCPYPQVSRYLGEGSIDGAENFACVDLNPAGVRIEPAILNLRGGGRFTAVLSLPESGLAEFGGETPIVVSEGAAAHKVKLKPNVRAWFDLQDMINIEAGEDFIFTVTAIYEKDGAYVAFEGSDSVAVKGDMGSD